MYSLPNEPVSATKTKYHPISVEPSAQSVPSWSLKTKKSPRYGAFICKTLAYAAVAVVPLALAIWLPQSIRFLENTNIFEGTPLGGSLSLTQAKAVDFVSSAILAPLVLTGFNYIWFMNARTSIADDRKFQATGVSLYALVEASGTSSGSYDLFKLWTLLCSRSGRLITFAILALFSALGKSALSNIIAYEAIQQDGNVSPTSLRLLAGPVLTSSDKQVLTDPFGVLTENSTYWYPTYDQRRTFDQDTTRVLQQVAWQNSTQVLDSGSYIALNTTTAALSRLDSSVVELQDVPSVRATIGCKSHKLQHLNLWPYNKGVGFQLQFDMWDEEKNTLDTTKGWRADIPATTDIFVDGDPSSSPYRNLDFLAYDVNSTSMLTGSLTGMLGPNEPQWAEQFSMSVASPFGDVQTQPFNLSFNGSGQDNITFYTWGILCTIQQESGLMNLTRNSADDNWARKDLQWSSTPQTRQSFLQLAQGTAGSLRFNGGKAGFGPAISVSADTCNSTATTDLPEYCNYQGWPQRRNFQTLAHNLLYAEMEFQRVSYETGAMNDSMATPDMYVSVASTGSVQRYRITYIPALLFAGLVCVFFAAVLVVALMIYSMNTVGHRTFRVIDSLRLLMDYVANNHDPQLNDAARSWSNQELEDWARNHKVKYEVCKIPENNFRPTAVALTAVSGRNDLHIDQ